MVEQMLKEQKNYNFNHFGIDVPDLELAIKLLGVVLSYGGNASKVMHAFSPAANYLHKKYNNKKVYNLH